MTPTIRVSFAEGSAIFAGTDVYGFPIWNWMKRIPDGRLVPGSMPKPVVQRIQRQQPRDAA